jgi:two-component system, OmpR family, response regulator
MDGRAQVKENYTPQEVGGLLGVHHNTIKNWIRSGKIRAFTTVGGHFRVLRREVARLVSDRGLPVPEELAGPAGMVYVLDRSKGGGDGLERDLGGAYRVVAFRDPFEAIMQMGRLAPDLLVLGLDVPGIDPAAFARSLHGGPGKHRVPVIGVGDESHQKGDLFDAQVAAGDREGLLKEARLLLAPAH